jgi:hypothetical protein
MTIRLCLLLSAVVNGRVHTSVSEVLDRSPVDSERDASGALKWPNGESDELLDSASASSSERETR